MSRGMVFEASDAHEIVAALTRDGFAAQARREPFAGEDDDEDHPWTVTTDAPDAVLELLLERYDGWLEPDQQIAPVAPLVLPDAPRRVKRPL